MSVQPFTFYYYLKHNDNYCVNQFKKVFENDWENLPDKLSSSKSLRSFFNLNSAQKEHLFQTTFLQYFKYKLTQCHES